LIFKVLWGMIKSLFGIVKWFFKWPIKCGVVETPFSYWRIIGGGDILYKPDNLPWESKKLPLKVRRIFRRGKYDKTSIISNPPCFYSPIQIVIHAIGYDNTGQIVIELCK